MPTGYTHKISEGISFNDFVWGCARGMGALITMRDSMDEPIPEKFEPSDYHKKKIEDIEQKLEALLKMTIPEADVEADKEYRKEIDYKKKSISDKDELRVKYNNMLEEVKTWRPPSEDHINFKKFMIEQITDSIDHDCDTKYTLRTMPTRLTSEQYISKKHSKLIGDLEYHRREYQEEVTRVEGRNRWLRQLRESLQESPCDTPTGNNESRRK